MLILLFSLIFASVIILCLSVVPFLQQKIGESAVKQQQKMSVAMEPFVTKQKAKRMGYLFVLCPVLMVAIVFIVIPQFATFALPMALVLGFIFPRIYINQMMHFNQLKFQDQLIDALMVMSSSFRGGLSLVQAMEAVVEEMPNPIQSEFALVLAENKMGVSLEDAMEHLYKRMPSVYLQQMITAVLLARETGGNLPIIFTRIIGNIRETKKVKQDLETMTIQGKIQGGVMTLLPIFFACVVYSTNKRVFDNMLHSSIGQKLLIAAGILWTIGAFMIWRISSYEDF